MHNRADIHGYSLEENEIQMEPDFLEEIMEINESLEDISIDEAKEIERTNTKEYRRLIASAAACFKKNDYAEAKQVLARLKYFASIDAKLQTILEREWD